MAKELSVVIPVSFYEKDVNRLFNTVAVIDADGSNLGIYRKTHIPDDHYYQEKFYFVPGDTGFQVFDTAYGKIGVGICWDQWFPETARAMAVKGAELLFYPTAIGSEPILECDSMPHWRRAMQGHAAANLMPVIAANRIGTEEVVPCEENGDRFYKIKVYFITLDEKSGAEKKTAAQMLAQASNLKDAIAVLEDGMKGTLADYTIASVTETQLMDVFPFDANSVPAEKKSEEELIAEQKKQAETREA